MSNPCSTHSHAEAPPMRIAKFLSAAGVCSRREAERRIASGRVRVDGSVLTSPATLVSGAEHIEIDGQDVCAPAPSRLWRFHKPKGVLTTNTDPEGRPTLFDALPASLPRVMTVGRLDFQTEGLLLLTNDGVLARALELPATGLTRHYRACVQGRISQPQLDRLAQGVSIDGIRYRPITARLCAPETETGSRGQNKGQSGVWIDMSFAEGKNREARRVLESFRLRVSRLVRLGYGPLSLAGLASGALEEVPSCELVSLFGPHIGAGRSPEPPSERQR